MSIKKNKQEIARLVKSFEIEAGKFHDITLKLFYVFQDTNPKNVKFRSPNHTIMLWQHYGVISSTDSVNRFCEDIESSDLQWGLRGAEISCFGVIEGNECALFTRMAKRAAQIFSDKEANFIKTRIISEIRNEKILSNSRPVAAVNDNGVAIWLNYLLYYISRVNPENRLSRNIEPDPFSLSLMALESLDKNPIIEKVDKSMTKVGDIKFNVSLSFPGEKRAYVSKVANLLKKKLGKDKVFYDFDYQSQLARPDLDTLLQKIYRENSDLVVIFLCKDYSDKEWCGLEWRAVRDLIKSKQRDKIMLIRFDNSDIEGLFSTDGYIDASRNKESDVARFIMERISLSQI